MRSSTAIGLGAATILVLDLAVAIETFRTGSRALGVLALMAAAVAVAVIGLARRPAVTLRDDLAAWTARTAAATGEPESRLLDRAVARHRDALAGDPSADVNEDHDG